MADDRLDVMVEAERRGIIDAGDQALLNEARKRGLVDTSGSMSLMLNPEELARRTAPPPSFPGQTVLPTLLSLVGSFVGGRAGAAIGREVGVGIGAFTVAGRAVGGGLGAAAGEEVNPEALAAMGNPGLERPSFFDLAKTGGLTAVVDLLTQAGIAAAGKTGFPVARPDARQAMDAFAATEVTPKVTDIAGSRGPAVAERALKQSPTAQGIVSGVEDQQAAQIMSAKERFLASMGPEAAKDAQAAGGSVAAAVKKQVENVQGVENFLWDELRKTTNDVPVRIVRLKGAAQEILREEEKRTAPNAAVVKQMKTILSYGDEVAWQTVDIWRREFGEKATSALSADLSQGRAKLLVKSTLDDMERTANVSNTPGLAATYKNVRAFSEAKIDLFREHEAAKILDVDPEKVVSLLKGGGPSAATRAREAILGGDRTGIGPPTKEAQDAFAVFNRHWLEGAFKAATETPQGMMNETLSPLKFQKALPDRATLRVLLDETQLTALDNLSTVIDAVRRGERMGANARTSSTAQSLATQEVMRLPGQVLGGLAGFFVGSNAGPLGAAGGVAAGIKFGGDASFAFTSVGLAKLLTNPNAAAFMASPRFTSAAQSVGTAGRWTGEAVGAFARLGAIYVDQDLRERAQQKRR